MGLSKTESYVFEYVCVLCLSEIFIVCVVAVWS